MKTLQKVLIILMVAILTFGVMSQVNVSMATTEAGGAISGISTQIAEPDSTSYDNLQIIIGRLLGFLQIASAIVAVVMIVFVGFNYIVATPTVKEELKKTMLPILIGVVIVFGATSIARFVLGAIGG